MPTPNRGFKNTPAETGSHELIAGVSGKKIVILQMLVFSSLANKFRFTSNSTTISADKEMIDDSHFILPYCPDGYYETVAGEALKVDVDVAAGLCIDLMYQEE